MLTKKQLGIHHCRKCGKYIHFRRIYCERCSPIAEKQKNNERCKRFRENNREIVNIKHRHWVNQHPEQRKQHTQKYLATHAEAHYERLKQWRLACPEKYKTQRERNNAKLKQRRAKRKNRNVRAPPGEGNQWFKKKLEEFLLVGGECIDCGKFILKPPRGRLAERCVDCNVVHIHNYGYLAERDFKQKNPAYDAVYNRLRRNNGEIVVAGECVRCHCLVIFAERGMRRQYCEDCAAFVFPRKNMKRDAERHKRETPISEFIENEKTRLGLNSRKRWTPYEIKAFYEHYKHYSPLVAIAYDE